ncbi:MAG TPA: PKD domain-containing protein [Candidatus Binatia bacterium]|nr:PKD domain-containing protein [Candidatus Binatia bacterium]
MLRAAVVLLLLAGAVGDVDAAGVRGRRVPTPRPQRPRRETLLLVATPTNVGPMAAHPFVNAKVYFGRMPNGAVADPRTFRARLGRHDVTSLFVDFTDSGGTGKRARLDPPLLRTGPHTVNRLRLKVRSMPFGPHHRRVRDIDHIRFRAVDTDDRSPTAVISTAAEMILPGVPIQFNGAGSFDPDHDWLAYDWDFGDGTPHATDASPTHVFADGTGDVTVTLTVTDGARAATTQTGLLACPALDPGRTPGTLRLDADARLELAAVPVGGTGATTITVRNLDQTPTSQLRVRFGTDAAAFTVSPSAVDLPAEAQAEVTLRFSPTAPGHQHAFVTAVACGTNRPVIHAVAHGYGGTAPGTGPTFAADPVFGNVFGQGTFTILPSGARVAIDNGVGVCAKLDHSGTRDLCVESADCVNPGESCDPSATTLLEPNDMCGDGQGNLYLLSDQGTFTEPNGDGSKTESILHLKLDAGGNRTGADMFARTTDETINMACDRRANGAIYLARAMDLPLETSCFRDAQEDLLALRKANGGASVLYGPIDQAEGQDACNGDFDETGDVEVSRDGSSVFVSFQTEGGIYRIIGPPPTPLEIVPDVDDVFQVHPDGAILYAEAKDPGGDPSSRGTTGRITLYKIFPEQSVSSPLPLAQRTPCAVFTLPNNQGVTRLGDISIAAGRTSPGSNDAVVLVSFGTSEGAPPHAGQPLVLGRNLRVEGTVAFSSPAGNVPCAVLGLVNVEQIDPLTF